jgi:Zn-dependent M16 (insulinase) family peptidase
LGPDRTNAWTATDHTCYTIYSAGSGGFLNILPVYLDHILFPLLREEDFLTEVHHITAEGADSGVVYSEMQVSSLLLFFVSLSLFSLIAMAPRHSG